MSTEFPFPSIAKYATTFVFKTSIRLPVNNLIFLKTVWKTQLTNFVFHENLDGLKKKELTLVKKSAESKP